MRYLDVCAGISASTVAWKPLGWEAAAYSEIEAAPRAVLAHHYPDTPLHGDFTTIRGDEYGAIDLLVGGTPCQDFSIGGLRAGLDGKRGGLSLEYLRLADRTRSTWLVWENVTGVLSLDGGRAFGAILGGLAELGYGFAYRVLDARGFHLSDQPRERVILVANRRDWRAAGAVLFERSCLEGHQPTKAETAPVLTRLGGVALDDRTPCVLGKGRPRRTTPREWERALGFEDDYTLVSCRGRPLGDGLRYKALGNSMAVPVMRWIGERIQAVENLLQTPKIARPPA
jgi:DNA (cytosine-5)-methyltransferase 1